VTAHEQQRLAALHEYRLLDAPADGGRIWADTNAGGGTTVSFPLPEA
jgi:hypothetical protein